MPSNEELKARIESLLAAADELAALLPAEPGAPHNRIRLDFPVTPDVRFGWDKPAHPLLSDIIESGRRRYARNLESFAPLIPDLATITQAAEDPYTPHWINDWLPALDAVSIYGFLATRKPRRYIEIGSGTSTKFARRAINYHSLETKIVSIDPSPRSAVNDLCNEIVRAGLETSPLAFWQGVTKDDIVFFDGSHRAFQNSDVTVFFLDILPRFPKGTLVGIHDIFLPHDYPADWRLRFYSEQYMLACWLLAGDRLHVELPALFCAKDAALKSALQPLWEHPNLAGANHAGGAFWFTCR